MKILLIALLFSMAAGSGAMADTPDSSPDSRIKALTYSDNDVYTITAKYGYQTNIVFGKGEEIQTISVGDRSLWQIIPSGNRLFIRPMVYGVETNMTLITNKHSYQFDLKSVADEKSGGNIYVARFVYPENKASQAGSSSLFPPASLLAQAALGQMPPARPEPTLPPISNPVPAQPQPVIQPAPVGNTSARHAASLNYNYTYTGPDAAAPVQAYDDGKSTFIQYREDQPLPGIYAVEAGGATQSVSYNIDNNLIIINKVAGEWLLQNTNGTVHLYNEMLNPK